MTIEQAVAQPTSWLQHFCLARFVLGMDTITAGFIANRVQDETALTLPVATYIAEHWEDPR